jgi:hypothetical protein
MADVDRDPAAQVAGPMAAAAWLDALEPEQRAVATGERPGSLTAAPYRSAASRAGR